MTIDDSDAEGRAVRSAEDRRKGDDEAGNQREAMDLVCGTTRGGSEGLRSLDSVSLEDVFEHRALVIKNVPSLMREVLRTAMKLSLKEISKGLALRDESTVVRGWKLFMLLPRLLLFRPPRGGVFLGTPLQEPFRRPTTVSGRF